MILNPRWGEKKSSHHSKGETHDPPWEDSNLFKLFYIQVELNWE